MPDFDPTQEGWFGNQGGAFAPSTPLARMIQALGFGQQAPSTQLPSGMYSAPPQSIASSIDPSLRAVQMTDPNALERASNVALGMNPGVLGGMIKAYHGSPYDFSAFDASKIGTGEGAQAYGHGLYFAENPETAQSYRDKLAGVPIGPTMDLLPEYFKPGNIVPGYGGQDRVLEYRPQGDFGFNVKVQEVNKAGDAIGPPRWHSTMPTPQEIQSVLGKKLGKTYEVNINADPEMMLDWDKPLSEQSQKVRELANSSALYQQDKQAFGDYLGGAEKQWTGQKLHQALSAETGDPVATAERLRDAGIPGIRYLDQGSRAGGKGTSNYVVFDPRTIDIIRKYGIAALLGGGVGAAALSQGQQAQAAPQQSP